MPWRPRHRHKVEVIYFKNKKYYMFFLLWLSDSFEGRSNMTYPHEVIEQARKSRLRDGPFQ